MDEQALWIFLIAAMVSALAGVAALLRTKQVITAYNLLGALLNSGLLGLCVALLWYKKFIDNPYFLVGICVLAGLGGMPTVEFVLDIFKRVVLLRFKGNANEK